MEKLLECFIIGYHNVNHKCKILNDHILYNLSSNDEYNNIKSKLSRKTINLISSNILALNK